MTTPPSQVLAINAGSSSVKCALFTAAADPQVIVRETIDAVPSADVPRLLAWIDKQSHTASIPAIGHRVVHGGPDFVRPVRLTSDVLAALRRLIPFAPNHLPDEIALIEALQRHCPGVPQIACFDTAFHADLPDVARRLPIPQRYDAESVRRYGFHGLSYAYLMQELGRVVGGRAARGRIILAHLGNGSSLAAVHNGRSVDTTMAFTPIGGVVMSTRSGDLDPGVVTYLGRSGNLSADELEELLSRKAGLLGISGTSGDMRLLLTREATDPACRLAIAVYAYSIKKAIGGLAAALGGLDTLVFSGGIGEHSATVRARICDGLTFLGIELDPTRNDTDAPVISTEAGRVMVRVLPTDEEQMIARAVHRVLAGSDT